MVADACAHSVLDIICSSLALAQKLSRPVAEYVRRISVDDHRHRAIARRRVVHHIISDIDPITVVNVAVVAGDHVLVEMAAAEDSLEALR